MGIQHTTAIPARPCPVTLGLSQYEVWTQYPDRQLGSSDPFRLLDDAVDHYLERRDEGFPAVVWLIEPSLDGSAPMMTDVTVDAERHLSMRLWQRGDDMPEWML